MKKSKLILIVIFTMFCLPSFAAVNNYLFIVSAKNATVKKSNASQYMLVLKDVDLYTTYFSDRPQRITGLIKTANFVKNWQQTFGNNNTSPNVAVEGTQLHSISKNAKDNVEVLTLSNPVYKDHQLIFQISNLNKNINLEKIKHVVLFVDNGYCPCCAAGSCDMIS